MLRDPKGGRKLLERFRRGLIEGKDGNLLERSRRRGRVAVSRFLRSFGASWLMGRKVGWSGVGWNEEGREGRRLGR